MNEENPAKRFWGKKVRFNVSGKVYSGEITSYEPPDESDDGQWNFQFDELKNETENKLLTNVFVTLDNLKDAEFITGYIGDVWK